MTSRPSPWPPEPHRSLSPELAAHVRAKAAELPPLPDDVAEALRGVLAASEGVDDRTSDETDSL
jgi:hypothetical protein